VEDFVTRTHDADGRNVVDDYLKRRGWKESVATKRYLQALRDSDMSLYEVDEVVPGQSFVARDLVRGGPPVLVSDHNVTQILKNADRIATRIVELNGKRIVSAGMLPFDRAMSEDLLEAFEAAKREMPDLLQDLADEDGVPLDAAEQRAVLDTMATTLAPPLVSAVWLESRLDHALGDSEPELVTSEGDDIEFHSTHFPLLPDASADAVRDRLDGIAALRSDRSDDFWTWVAPRRPAPQDGARDTLVSATELDDEDVLGAIGLSESNVTFTTNSAARAARGQAMLTSALDGLVGAPLTKIVTLEQAMDANAADPPPLDSNIPPQAQAELLHSVLQRHYRALLDQPIPMLGNVSPREAARTVAGREKLAAWRKQLEDGAALHSATGNPLGTYDFGWIWAELGAETLRK
jgi:hypothetical protein